MKQTSNITKALAKAQEQAVEYKKEEYKSIAYALKLLNRVLDQTVFGGQ